MLTSRLAEMPASARIIERTNWADSAATSVSMIRLIALLTLAIVLPPIYVSNAFVGAQLLFRQMLAMLLGSVAITVTVLSSMATVAFFFALTSRSYDFIKLLHVLFFAYAGLTGLFIRFFPGLIT